MNRFIVYLIGFFHLAVIIVSFLFIDFSCLLQAIEIPTYTVIIDPGHGGAFIHKKGSVLKSDRWDPVSKKYLSNFNYGMYYNGYHEHLIVLDLAKEVDRYLRLTTSKLTWPLFQKILRQFSSQEEFDQIIIKSILTRKHSWNHLYKNNGNPNINAPYRLFDYPDDRNRKRFGRLSFINHKQPSLVVSLHMTPAPGSIDGGMAGVLSPGYRTFNLLRNIHLKKESIAKWRKSIWNGKFLNSKNTWTQYQLARSDAWVYFHGFPSDQYGKQPQLDINRGIRQNLISWKYADNSLWINNYDPEKSGPFALDYKKYKPQGKFWDRERSQAELWRREDGPLGYGGDNHYATDELLRFVQYGARILNKKFQKENMIGAIYQPYVSAYTLPIYVNAIVAFLEIGHLDRKMDRNLIIKHKKLVAKSLAVGIYSLYAGMQLREIENPFQPKAKKLNFQKYQNLPTGDYFKAAFDQ